MATDSRIGTELAGYRIESMLGRGGMSVVYLAEDVRLKRKAALKLLAPDLAEDPNFRQRFITESELAASLDHPNVIPIFEAGEADGVLFIAMRYVKTTDLKALIKAHGRLPADRALSICGQTASALDAAHAQGLVHRDVKPANILVAEGQGSGGADHVYLSDFGLTKRREAPTGLTRTGQFVGTVDYVAPEQIEGRDIDGRTDQYALACVLYESLAGHPPFVKETETAALIAHLMEAPPRITAVRSDLPGALDDVLARGMSREMDGRYPDCASFVRAAREAVQSGAPSAAPGRSATQFAAPPAYPPAGFQPAVTTPGTFQPAPEPAFAPPAPPRKRRTGILVGAVVAALAVVGVLVVVLAGGGGEPQADGSGGATTGAASPGETPSFSDDFSDPETGQWDRRNTGSVSAGYTADGQYRVQIKRGGAFDTETPKLAELQNLGDVAVSVDVTKVTGSGANAYGVACRTGQGTQSYYFVISAVGGYAIEKSDGTTTTQLANSTATAIRKGNATNHILGICTGTGGGVTLTMIVNGTEIQSYTDPSQPFLSAGAVGVTVFSDRPGLDVRFDNFEVESPLDVPSG